MKTMLVVSLFVSFAVNALGYYLPGQGRWLSRDPIGEPGFQAILRGPSSVQAGEPNPYTFVRNSPLGHIDPLGLIEFEGCEGREEEIQKQFDDFCKKVKDPQFANCISCNLSGRTVLARLKNRCNNPDDSLHGIKVKCHQSDSGLCSGACAWSIPGGDTIHVCPQQWTNPNCGQTGCTLMHELTHMSGRFGEKWPDKVEECLGCR